MRVITIAYYALIRPDLVPLVKAGGDAAEAQWITVAALKASDLAFDHDQIVERAVACIADRIDSSSIAASLVPKTFTIPELRHVHAILSRRPQDPGNFRRKFERLLEDGVIEQAPRKTDHGVETGDRVPLRHAHSTGSNPERAGERATFQSAPSRGFYRSEATTRSSKSQLVPPHDGES